MPRVRRERRSESAMTARATALPRREAWHRDARAALAYRPPAWADLRGIEGRLHPVELCRAVAAFLEDHPDGTLIGRIHLPAPCSNLCFGGARKNRLFMPVSQSLFAVYVETTGAQIP